MGVGQIGGIELPKLAQGVGMQVVASTDPYLAEERAPKMGVTMVELEELIPPCRHHFCPYATDSGNQITHQRAGDREDEARCYDRQLCGEAASSTRAISAKH